MTEEVYQEEQPEEFDYLNEPEIIVFEDQLNSEDNP
jgi:hypothetical protein